MKKFEEFVKERYLVDDPDDILLAVADYLDEKAEEIEREEPYATNTVRRLHEAAREVWKLQYDED